MQHNRLLNMSIWILILVCITVNAIAAPVVIAFTRHTFRGVSKIIPPKALAISNLKIQDATLSYAMNATPNGLAIAKKFAQDAYNNGAILALKTIHENPALAGHWSVIRTDLAQERTFSTAVNLYQGLSKISRGKISLIGCRTTENMPVDYIATDDRSVIACVSPQLITQESDAAKAKITEKFMMLANHLISLLGGKPNINESNFKFDFPNIRTLSNQIEMSSDLGGLPLQYVLEDAKIKSSLINREAVITAMQLLGYSLLMDSTNTESEALTLLKANYINSLKSGTQEIVVTHDTRINALLYNLGFLSENSVPNDLSIYPLETITIALNAKRVAIVRTRINISDNGSMTGAAGFKSWVFWSGTRQAWNAHVSALQEKINAEKRVAACIQKIPLCQPVLLNVTYLL